MDGNYNNVTTVTKFVRDGKFLLRDSTFNYAVIGANIGIPMNVNVDHPSEPLRITVPRKGVQTALTPADEFNTLQAIPSGIFSIQQEFDSKYVFVSLPFARELLGLDNQVSAYEIKLKNANKVEEMQKQIAALVGH